MSGYRRRRGMGDAPATCYYWVQDANGIPVCGDIGGGAALLTNPTNNPDIAQLTLNAVESQVRNYATQAANLKGTAPYPVLTGQENYVAECAARKFQALVTVNDVFAPDATARLNNAANQAVQYVLNGGCGNFKGGWIPIPNVAAQLTPNKYPPFPYCDDRSPQGLQDCQFMERVVSGSGDFVAKIAGAGTPVDNPLHDLPNPGTVASSGIMTPAPVASATVAPSYPVVAPETVPAAGVFVQSDPLPPTFHPQLNYDPAKVGPSGIMTSAPFPAPVPVASSTLSAPGGAQNIPGIPAATAATGSTGILDSATSWVSANPLFAAGLAAGLAFMFFSGKGGR